MIVLALEHCIEEFKTKLEAGLSNVEEENEKEKKEEGGDDGAILKDKEVEEPAKESTEEEKKVISWDILLRLSRLSLEFFLLKIWSSFLLQDSKLVFLSWLRHDLILVKLLWKGFVENPSIFNPIY